MKEDKEEKTTKAEDHIGIAIIIILIIILIYFFLKSIGIDLLQII